MLSLSIPGATLRPLRPDDAPAVTRGANDAGLAANCGPHFPHPYHLSHAEEFCTRKAELTAPYSHFAVCLDDEVVGMMGFVSPIDPLVPYGKVGYWVAAAARGRELGSRALDSFANYAFAHWSHLQRLEADVFAHNIASQRVLEKAGFVCEAKLARRGFYHGQPVDELVYARLR